MFVCPAARRGRRALSALTLLLCLLAGAGCAARNRPAAVPTATPTLAIRAVPTFTPAAPASVTPTAALAATALLTPPPATPVAGVYADLAAHHHGRYRLQRHGDLVEATFMTTRSPVPAGTQLPPPVLFTLPPAFRPPFPVLRRVTGQVVLADGSADPASPDPRPFRLQLEPDGRVHYLEHPELADLDYLAYTLHLAWGITPAANDRAILRILDRPRFEDLPDGYHRQSGGWTVYIEDGRVTQLQLADFKAPVPPELGQLSQLKSLMLVGPPNKSESGDPWSGPIPPELGQLVNLIYLDLRDNQLTGTIPPELGQLDRLWFLHLDGNQLTGAIPPELGQLVNLLELNLGSNQLTGPIPPEIGQLVSLEKLYLSGNQLTGPIPPEIGQLRILYELNLSSNQLTGAIPPALGQLQNLHALSLVRTQLTGPLPPQLGLLVNLITLHLFENQLTGEIPPELGQLYNLQQLSLSDNQLTGPIPPQLGQLQSLTVLRLDHNQLTGPIPPELGQLVGLQYLSLLDNQLTGCVPTAGMPRGAEVQFSEPLSFCTD